MMFSHELTWVIHFLKGILAAAGCVLVCEPVNWLAGFLLLLLLLSDCLSIDFSRIFNMLTSSLITGFLFVCLFETFINNCISVVRQNNSDPRLEKKDSPVFAIEYRCPLWTFWQSLFIGGYKDPSLKKIIPFMNLILWLFCICCDLMISYLLKM